MACTAARMFASNATLCACEPGFYLSAAINGTCLGLPDGGWQVGSVGSSRNQSFYFLTPVLSLDVVRRLTQSQALLLEATIAALLSWLAFCAFARFTGHDPTGNKRLFRARFWVSRLDCIYDTTHWAVSFLFFPFFLLITSCFLQISFALAELRFSSRPN